MKSNKLFQIKCDCDTLYDPDEIKQCPTCSKEIGRHKELFFDSDKFLNILYGVEKNVNPDEKPMDLLFDVYYNLHNNFHIMNDIIFYFLIKLNLDFEN